LGACLSAQAQATTDAPTTGALSPALSLQRARYVAAHDSLMRLAAGVRDRVEAGTGFFQASQGTLGGLHRRVRSYLDPGSSLVIKNQAVKRR